MNRFFQLAAILGLLVITATPAQAWWGSGNKWSPWGGSPGYYGPRYYGYNPGPWNYGPGYAPQYYDYDAVEEDDTDEGERKSPFANNPWKKWRAPWSDDDSRWGSGPWDAFGDSMNNFISEMEGDVDLKMRIRAENEARSKARSRGDARYRGDDWGFNSSGGYGYPYYGYPYYGYPTQPRY